MESKLELQQLSFSLIANNYNPARITPDFLAASGIIPQDWELASKPVVAPNMVQLKFKNGLSIIAQPGTITFSEAIRTSSLEEMEAAKVASRYLESLPAADYQLLKISPMNLYNLGTQADTVRKLIVEALLAPAPWHSFGSAPLKATVNLVYQLEHCQLSLKVDEARFQQGDANAIPGLLFVGDFIYSQAELTGEAKINSLKAAIDNWQQDVSMFQEKISANIIKTAQAAISSQPESIKEKALVESA
ncbi:hypothetical protein IQ238_11565 [Pleurocapsales cyanobacterium LEGE 06147]|nr:hypothetical protein [Pleurocapsales cyanobacterium LEGE 06147]